MNTNPLIKTIFEKALSKSRAEALIKKGLKPKLDRMPYVSTFHPQKPDQHATHSTHVPILKKYKRMSAVLLSRPLIAYCHTPKLNKIIVKTKTRRDLSASSTPHLSFPPPSSSSLSTSIVLQPPKVSYLLCTKPRDVCPNRDPT